MNIKYIPLILTYLLSINSSLGQEYCIDWGKNIGDVADNYSYDIVTDNQLNTYITGIFRGSQDFGGVVLESKGTADIFIAKYSPDGQLLWANRAGGGTNYYEHGKSICVDKFGNCYLGGTFRGLGIFNSKIIQSYEDTFDAFICKYSNSGDLLWVNKIGGNDADEVSEITLDSEGNIVFAGAFRSKKVWMDNDNSIDGISQHALIMAKFNDKGKLIWDKKLFESTSIIEFCLDIDIDDNIYTAGTFFMYTFFEDDTIRSETGDDTFIAKFNKEGNRKWLKQVGGSINIRTTSILLDHIGNLYLSGHFNDTIYFDGKSLVSHGESDIYISKSDTSGKVKWVTSMGDNNLDESYDLAYSLSDEIFMIGRFEDSIQLGSQLLQSNGLIDILVSRIDSAGMHLNSQALGGDSDSHFDDRGYGIDIDTQNGVSITGNFHGIMNFDNDSLVSNGQHDIYIIKWDTCQVDTTYTVDKEVIVLGPNPTLGRVNVIVPQDYEKSRLRIINLTGQVVYDKIFYDQQFSIDLNVPKGCYIFLFSNELNYNTYFKVIKN